MAALIMELLGAIVRSFVEDGCRALFLKVGTWLERRGTRRTAQVIIGLLLGLAAFFLVPVLCGILGV